MDLSKEAGYRAIRCLRKSASQEHKGMAGTVLVSREGSVATLTLSNPGKLNAIDLAMWNQLAERILSLTQEKDLRCLLVRGDGPEAFSSGADIAEFVRVRSNLKQAKAFGEPVHRAFRLLHDFPIPTLAAIRGVCAGGGLELAACCDLRVATPDSRLGIPINRIGASLCYAELEPLLSVAGPGTALEILLEGRMMSADEALLKGFLNRVVAAIEFEHEIAATTRRIVEGAPLVARWHKKFVRRLQRPEPLTEAEIDEGYACFDTEDYWTGCETFVNKRKPAFQGK
jgi:enoyl-CoA hydratase/carnithine racemase